MMMMIMTQYTMIPLMLDGLTSICDLLVNFCLRPDFNETPVIVVSPYISDYPNMNANISILEIFDSNKPNINAHCENIGNIPRWPTSATWERWR